MARYVGERPFKTDYAGAWSGHSKSREGAVIAAMKHVVRDGYNKATITDMRTNRDVARVRVNADRTSATVEVIHPFKVIK